MKLRLLRDTAGKDSTPGTLYVNGVKQCKTLEDEPRVKKVAGETRIPAGHYVITLRTVGSFNERYAKTFGDIHHGMLWIRDVPGFEYILIHCGNNDSDTAGCLLVGSMLVHKDGEWELRDSKVAYRKFYPPVAAALIAGEPVTIVVEDAPQDPPIAA